MNMNLFKNLQLQSDYNKLTIESIKDLVEQEAFFEIAKLSKNDSKLKYDIWLDSAGSNRKVPHNKPRIKLVVDNNMIPISISKNPKFLVDVSKYKKLKTLILFLML